MPTSTQAPIIHPGPLHVGPSVPWALNGDRPKSGKRRPQWNERHHATWDNDFQAPNTRSYFDRFVDRAPTSITAGPHRRLRPVWALDVPAVEIPNQVYRVFDAPNACWKDQRQWLLPSTDAQLLEQATKQAEDLANLLKSGSGKVAKLDELEPTKFQIQKSSSPPPKAKKPSEARLRRAADLGSQRERESEWKKDHSVLFSRFNDHYQINVRSYFDRWKDAEGGRHEREPPWRLKLERKPLFKSSSEPNLGQSDGFSSDEPPAKPVWVSNFST